MEIALSSATAGRLPEAAMLLIPVGSTAHQGPYLPLGTDTEIASAVAEAAAKLLRRRRLPVVVAPPLAYGAPLADVSPGSISLPPDLLRSALAEIVRSASGWASRFVVVNSGPANDQAVDEAITDLVAGGISVVATNVLGPDAEVSLGQRRTSLMLHLKPWEVRRALAMRAARVDGASYTVGEGGFVNVPRWARADDVVAASSEEGRELLDRMSWFVAHHVLEAQSPRVS